MILVQEIVILAMEILGILLICAGVGAAAAWWLGMVGALLAGGVCLLCFAMLAAMRQKSLSAPPKSATNSSGRR